MADLERTIAIIFAGEDQSSPAFNAVTGHLGALEATVERVAGQLADAADWVLKMDGALAAMAVGGLAYAVKQAGDFNSQTALISTLVHDSSFNLDRYRQDILNYSLSSSQSIEKINAALYEAISTGSRYEDSISTLRTAEQLSVAGKGELSSSLLLVLQSLNAYGVGIDQATRFADVFFKTTELGVVKIPELAAGLSQVTQAAAAAGIPIETVGAAIAEMTAKGMPAGEAITALKAIIKDLIDPSKEAQAAMSILGIQYGSTAIQAKGLEGILLQIYNRTGGNIDKIKELFGRIEGFNGVLALVANDGGRSFIEKLEEMRNASGAVAAAYEIMVLQFEYVNQRLMNTMRATFISVGQPLLDDWAKLAGSIGDLFKGVKISLDQGAFADVYLVIEDVMAWLSQTIARIAQMLPEALSMVNFQGFTDALRELGATLAGYFDGVDLSKPGELAKVLQQAVNILTSLTNVTRGMAESFKPFFDQLLQFLSKVAEGDVNLELAIGRILGTSKMVDELGLKLVGTLKLLEATGTDMGSAVEVSLGLWGTFWNGLEIGAKAIALVFVELAGNVNSVLNLLSVGLWDTLTNNSAKIADMRERLLGSMSTDLDEGSSALGRFVDTMGKLLLGTQSAETGVSGLNAALDGIPEETWVEIGAEINWPSLEKASEAIFEVAPSQRHIKIGVALDESQTAQVKQVASQLVSDIRTGMDLSLKPKVDNAALEKIKGQFETIQNSVEWKAKLDIAEAEASAKVMESMANTLGSAFESSGEVISSALDALSKYDEIFDPTGNRNFIKDVIEQELNIRERSMSATEALISKQIEFMDAKLRAMSKGDALIQIDGAGLQPHLEAFMWEILSAIQVRVNEEGHAMLFGI